MSPRKREAGRPRVAPPRPKRGRVARVLRIARTLGIELMPHQVEVARYVQALGAGARWLYQEVAWVIARQNGKTSLLVPLIIARLLEGARIMHTAQNRALPREVFLEVANALREHFPTHVRNIREANGQEQIDMVSGGVYRIVAPTSGGARGPANDVVIVDEVRELEDFSFIGAARPTLTASRNPQRWYMSNAGDEGSRVLNALRARAGVDPQLAYLEWSADPGRATEDRAGWAEANPALGFTITWEFLESEYLTYRLEGELSVFETEHLCRWVATMGKRVVADVTWERLRAEGLEAPRHPVLGVAVAGSRVSAVLAWTQTDGTVAITVAAEATGHPLDLDLFGRALKSYATKHHVTQAAGDPHTDRDLMRHLSRTKKLTVQELEAASARFVAMVDGGRLRWAEAEQVAMDLPYLTRAEKSGTWRAVARSADRPATAALAAIRAVYAATEPKPKPSVH